ncbi:MAG: cytochrome c oxidase subunit 3 [Bacteroidota bacterium]
MAAEKTVLERDEEELDSQQHHEYDQGWDGGEEKPFKASYGKLMMWYFLLSDAFTFAGFLIAYGALRFSMPTWPVPDFVFSTAPFGLHKFFPGESAPLIFVTFMSFLLIVSSVTMVRAVQEGQRENKNGVVFWMVLTIIGGAGFLSCQAWEWSNLITHEHMGIRTNPFGIHTTAGTYLTADGQISSSEEDTFEEGASYLIHTLGHSEEKEDMSAEETFLLEADALIAEAGITEDNVPVTGMDFPGFYLHEKGFIQRKFASGEAEPIPQDFGPKAFGALFFFITGFHGFHVFSGVLFLIIITVNVASSLYVARKNGHEMVEKIGLYWHFVDLVWVFVFLVFYLL